MSTLEDINYLLLAIETFGVSIYPSSKDIVLPDMKDVPFYEAVLEKKGKGVYLVTGNIKHFPEELFIVTPRQIIEILDDDEKRREKI